ncbi:MAG: hypothetical protein HY521_10165 [Proteobacteria bacterium]|nr:hypothetical protein [Pseudomonadota bacterium]
MAERASVTVWVDHLSLGALVRLALLALRRPVARVRYLTASPALAPLLRALGGRVAGLGRVEYAAHRLGGAPLPEAIQGTARAFLDALRAELARDPLVLGAVRAHGLGGERLVHHLLTRAYVVVLRPIELVLLARALAPAEAGVFLVRRSSLLPRLALHLGGPEIVAYRAPFAALGFRPRASHALDEYVALGYFCGSASALAGTLRFLVASALRAVLAGRDPAPAGAAAANIAVHFCQHDHGRDDLTDVYWWFDSGIAPASVTVFVDDPGNRLLIDALVGEGFDVRVRPTRLGRVPGAGRPFAMPAGGLLRGGAAALGFLLSALARAPRRAWIAVGLADFLARHAAYVALYRGLGVRLLFQLHDLDGEKAVKAEAIRTLGGLSLAAHSSVLPLWDIVVDKVNDVLLTWGPHTRDEVYTFFPCRAAFAVGFPYGYTFAALRPAARALRARFPGRFLLCYLDQNLQADIATPLGAHLAAWRVLLAVLARHREATLLWKMKKPQEATLAALLPRLPALARLLADGRIVVVARDQEGRRRRPAEAGLAADLAVGLGVSSAAAECAFAGIPALHFEPVGLAANGFVRSASGSALLADEAALQEAIEAAIEGRFAGHAQAARAAHARLDPFQDGRGHLRTGVVIAALQRALAQGAGPEAALAAAAAALEADAPAPERRAARQG